MTGLNDLLWFLHRTAFEIIPSILAGTFVYFFLTQSELFHTPNWLQQFTKFINSENSSFLHLTVYGGFVLFSSLLVNAFSNLIFIRIDELAKANLDEYPSYKRFSRLLERDFKELPDVDFVLRPDEMKDFMRYGIMQSKKEFNTYLWYKSTEFYGIRNSGVLISITAVLLHPLLYLKAGDNPLKYLVLALFGASTYIMLGFLIEKRIDIINRIEKDAFKKRMKIREPIGSPPRQRHILDMFIPLALTSGCALLSVSNGTLGVWGQMLTSIFGVGCIISSGIYPLLLQSFLLQKEFNRRVVDAFISMKYGDTILSGLSQHKNKTNE